MTSRRMPSRGTPGLKDRHHAVREAARDRVQGAVDNLHGAVDNLQGAVGQLEERATEALAQLKPKLRGWLHLGMFPLALIGGIVLVLTAPTKPGRIASIVFTATAALLFGVSAAYHRGHWSPRMQGLLKRFDHSNIFLIIAGTYTPFAVTLLPESKARTLLLIVWCGAIGGVLFRVLWVHAPRWLYVPVYVALGWVAVFYFSALWRTGGAAICLLIAAGGLLYSAGAVVYGIKRPDPSPRWFGFHEIFHACTLAAFVCHYIAVTLSLHSSAAQTFA